MSTGSLPRGFAPHHLGPPPRRPQQQQPPQQQRAAQQHMGAMYAPPAAAAAAPSLMKRPAAAVRDPYGASGPGALQRQAPPAAQRHSGDYGGPQYAQPQYPPSTPGSMQYGAPSPYGMQGGYHPGQWADSNADTSVESIPPEGFHTPGANGQAYGDASGDASDLTHMSPAPQSPYQHGKGAPQLLHADTPREGKKPPFLDGQQDGTPQFITRAAPHAQRSAAPPPPPAPAADVSQYAGFKSDLDGDTSLIRSEADKIAQRLLKTEQELERLKKQGDLIGESLRKQKALDIEAHHRTVPAQQVPTLPGHFDAEQWQAQADNKGVPAALQQQQQQPLPEKKTDPKTVSPTVAPSMAPHAASPAVGASPVPAVAKAASPPPQRAEAPVMQRAAAPVAQRAAAPPPQRAAAPNLGYPQPPTGAAEAPASAQPSSQKSPPPAQQSPPPQQPVTAAPKQPASPQFNYPMPPTPPTPPKQQTEAGGSSLSEVPNHPALKNPELAKSVVDDAQAESLGLPKGTMWFDPNDPAQMQMIKEQLEGKPAEAPAGPAGPPIIPKPKQATRHSRLVKEEELMDQKHSKLLHLPEEFDSQSQVIRCYKRLAPGLHPDVNKEPEAAAQLKSLTECCQVCLAELRKRSTAKVGELGTIGEEDEEEEEEGSPKKESGDGVPEGFILVDDVDPLEFYEEVFFHKQKHAQLKVKMGVSIEDLVNGNAAGFDIERRIVNDKGEQGKFGTHFVLLLQSTHFSRWVNPLAGR